MSDFYTKYVEEKLRADNLQQKVDALEAEMEEDAEEWFAHVHRSETLYNEQANTIKALTAEVVALKAEVHDAGVELRTEHSRRDEDRAKSKAVYNNVASDFNEVQRRLNSLNNKVLNYAHALRYHPTGTDWPRANIIRDLEALVEDE